MRNPSAMLLLLHASQVPASKPPPLHPSWPPRGRGNFTFCIGDPHTRQGMRAQSQSCPAVCDPVNSTMPGFPVLHYLPEFAQTHAHRVGDANNLILCYPLLLPSIFPSIRVFSNIRAQNNKTARCCARPTGDVQPQVKDPMVVLSLSLPICKLGLIRNPPPPPPRTHFQGGALSIQCGLKQRTIKCKKLRSFLRKQVL